MSSAAVAAIQYALDNRCDSPMEFLHCWMHGDFDAIRNEWENVPDEVFIGADPMFQSKRHPTAADLSQATRIIMDVKGGCLQAVYGDKLPEGVDVEVILRDWDNIENGDPDPMGEEYEPDVYYW